MSDSNPLKDLNDETVRIETLGVGITRQRLYERRLSLYTLQNIQPHSIEQWAAGVRSDMDKWSSSLPVLMVHDMLSVDEVTISVNLVLASSELDSYLPERGGRIAVLLPSSQEGTALHSLFQTSKVEERPRRVFFDYSDGMAWMKEVLD